MEICIVVPYPGAEQYTGVWAYEEKKIDFRHQEADAIRCTMAFGAVELADHFKRYVEDASVHFASEKPLDSQAWTVVLEVQSEEDRDTYILDPMPRGVKITGHSRLALLYGVYGLLELSGWRWFSPGAAGERVPARCQSPTVPKQRMVCSPAMPYGRGFDMGESFAYLQRDFLLWMVRNRLSVALCQEPTAALAGKLGLLSKFGGHIFEDMLRPDRPWANGETLFSAHPEWYGLPKDGKRTLETAMRTQLCVAHEDIFDYIGGELIHMLGGEWKNHDRIDIWGFDTWGSECHCSKCQTLGNNTDRAIYFLSMLRKWVDRACKDGILDHTVQLIMCSYEGTVTIQAPTRPTPENLVKAKDGMVFYPINRCYEHTMEDPACSINRFYHQQIVDWAASPNALPTVIGEYYNVSKFEDLPLLFQRTIGQDMAYYHRNGFLGATYMHVPMMLWGVRAITQYLYAQLAWNPQADVQALQDEYFAAQYGEYEPQVRQLYGDLEEALSSATLWRAWDRNSLLSQLLRWDGHPADALLDTNGHLPQGAVKAGEATCAILRAANETVMQLLKEERTKQGQMAYESGEAVNPAQLQRINGGSDILVRLEEMQRQVNYALDMMDGMTAACAYHDALVVKDAAAQSHWQRLEDAEMRLASYYMPITGYKQNTLRVDDALTRAQLRGILCRCRIAREN